MTKFLIIGLGGFFGAILRYLMSGVVQGLSGSIGFPWGTLAVNLTGCFFIGLLSAAAELRALLSPEARLFLLVGLLGAFTTYSTFGNETLNLGREAGLTPALLNIALHVVAGLLLVFVGRGVALVIWR